MICNINMKNLVIYIEPNETNYENGIRTAKERRGKTSFLTTCKLIVNENYSLLNMIGAMFPIMNIFYHNYIQFHLIYRKLLSNIFRWPFFLRFLYPSEDGGNGKSIYVHIENFNQPLCFFFFLPYTKFDQTIVRYTLNPFAFILC